MISPIIPFYQPSEQLLFCSKDCYQFDTTGKKYIDFESGVWCTNLGHSHDRIVRVIHDQSRFSIHHGYRFRNEISERLSLELLGLLGMEGGQSVFLSSGSEAVNLAITLARQFTDRSKILKMDLSYLSAFGFGQIVDSNTDLLTVQMDDLEAIDHIDFSTLAAFVFEPGTSFGFIHFPQPLFIQEIVQKCRKHGVLLIADEVTCGFGRTGKWFGFQHYPFAPDIVATGKALGNGYPLSAVSINSIVSEWFGAHAFRYAQSHQNDPLGCAIGLEVIRTFHDDDIIRKSVQSGAYLKNKLALLQKKFPHQIKDVRGRGMMLAAELWPSVNGEKINERMFYHGFIVGYKSNVLRFMPPLVINYEDIESLIGCLDQLLQGS